MAASGISATLLTRFGGRVICRVAEAETVAMRISAHKFEHRTRHADYAVLYRGNHQARLVEEAGVKVAVIDRNFSFGASGIFAQEVRAALCSLDERPSVFGFIAGLGGRDVTVPVLEEIYLHARNNTAPDRESIWVGLREVQHAAS